MTVKVEFTAPEVTKTLASVTKDVVAPSTEDALTVRDSSAVAVRDSSDSSSRFAESVAG